MSLNRTFFRVEVTETDRDRNFWAAREGVSAETIAAIRDADIVVVPWDDRGKKGLSFPVGTSGFYRTLVDRFKEGTVALAVDRIEYAELSLHANETRWPTVIVSTVLLGAMANILSDEVEKAMSSAAPPTSIEMRVIVENERGRCISVDYKGPPGRLADTLVAETERCLPSAKRRP